MACLWLGGCGLSRGSRGEHDVADALALVDGADEVFHDAPWELADVAAERSEDATVDSAVEAAVDAARDAPDDVSGLDAAADVLRDAAMDDGNAPRDIPEDTSRDVSEERARMDAGVGCATDVPRGLTTDAPVDRPDVADAMPLVGPVFYVSPTGVDPPSGGLGICAPGRDVATPLATIGRALDCIAWGSSRTGPEVGATIYLRAGVYDYAFAGAFAVRGGASWAQPVTLASYPGEQAIIRPSTARAADFVFVFSRPDEQYIVLDGLVIDAVNVAVDAVKITSGGDRTMPAHHIRVQNCEVRNAASGHGILVTGGHHNEFINLRVHHNGLSVGSAMSNTGYGFYVASPDNLIERCEVYENGGYGICVFNTRPSVPTPFSRTDRTVVRYNYLHDNGRVRAAAGSQYGLILSSGVDLVGHHNVVVGCALQVAYEGVHNAALYNNTVVDPVESACVGTLSGVVFTARNNLCHASGRTLMLSSSTGALVASNNLVNVDPLFVNRSSGDYNLGSSSPAYDFGAPVMGFAYNGTAPEAGALEAPVVRAAEVLAPARDTVRVTVENNLHPPVQPAVGCLGFSVTAAGVPVAVTACRRVAPDAFDLTLASSVAPCEPVRLAYAGGNVTDSARIGGRLNASLRSVTGLAVTNP